MLRYFFLILFSPIRVLYYFYLRLSLFLQRKKTTLSLEFPSFFETANKSFLVRKFQGKETTLTRLDFLTGLRSLGKVPYLKTLKIYLPPMDWSLSEFWEVKEELNRLKSGGVSIQGYAKEGGLGTLLLLSACSERYAGKDSEFHIQLPSAETAFYGDFLKAWGIEVEAFASGPFKSFAESFTRNGFSKDARKNTEDLILNLQNILLTSLSLDGKLKKELFYKPIQTAEGFRSIGFIDSILTEKEFLPDDEPRLNETIGYHFHKLRSFSLLPKKAKLIAVVPLEGGIVGGDYSKKEREIGKISAYSTIALLRELKEDKSVSCVVLEISSPGGSAFHSELIHQEILNLKESKPVLAYFKDVAASGGYYIASAAESITASEVCITGSIGAVMVRANLKKLYNRAKVKKESVGFYPYRDILSEYTPLGKESVRYLQEEIKRIESQFYARVIEGRKIEPEKMKTLGGGRVYLPNVENKIVDKLGGILDVLESIKDKFPKTRFAVSYELPEYDFRSELPSFGGLHLKQMLGEITGMEIFLQNGWMNRDLYLSSVRIRWKNR